MGLRCVSCGICRPSWELAGENPAVSSVQAARHLGPCPSAADAGRPGRGGNDQGAVRQGQPAENGRRAGGSAGDGTPGPGAADSAALALSPKKTAGRPGGAPGAEPVEAVRMRSQRSLKRRSFIKRGPRGCKANHR